MAKLIQLYSNQNFPLRASSPFELRPNGNNQYISHIIIYTSIQVDTKFKEVKLWEHKV